MIFSNNNTQIFFAHIPRTGGCYTSELLKQNNYVMYPDPIVVRNGVTVRHYHREIFIEHSKFWPYDVSLMKQFTIVRDPVEKFTSAYSYVKSRLSDLEIENLYDEKEFFKIMYLLLKRSHFEPEVDDPKTVCGFQRDYSNWCRPQHEFITDEMFVWKYEDGLSDDFYSWLHTNLGIEIKNVVDRDWDKLDPYNAHNESKIIMGEYELPEPIVQNVQKFYSKDFECFRYSKKDK